MDMRRELTRSRMVFLYDTELGFAPPYRKALSYHFEESSPSAERQGERMFEAGEIQAILIGGESCDSSDGLPWRTGGFYNQSHLMFDKLNLKTGWHQFARPKTHNPRRCPLWPETARAIAAAIKLRPYRCCPVSSQQSFRTGGVIAGLASRVITLSSELSDLLKELKLYREGNTFYSLRRTLGHNRSDGWREELRRSIT